MRVRGPLSLVARKRIWFAPPSLLRLSYFPCIVTSVMAISVERHGATSSTNPLRDGNAHPVTPAYEFSFTNFLKREYRFGLDPNRPFCKAFREGHCPLGHDCPDKHQITHSFNNLVCKHWLRGLCKKGAQCEFLHEFNL